MLFQQCTDISCGNVFAWLNQGPLTLTITLHLLLILPMVWIYFDEKKKHQPVH